MFVKLLCTVYDILIVIREAAQNYISKILPSYMLKILARNLVYK